MGWGLLGREGGLKEGGGVLKIRTSNMGGGLIREGGLNGAFMVL